MIFLYILFGVLMGVAALVGLAIFASLLTYGLFTLAPHLQSTWLGVEITVRKWRLPDKTWREEQPFAVSICLYPLAKPPAYLVGLVRRDGVHRITFSPHKQHARVFNDMLAVKAWCSTLEERHGHDPFVVMPPRRQR